MTINVQARLRRRLIPAAWALLLCAASGPGRLRFTRAVDLPDSGLALRLPAGATPEPVPPPEIRTARRSDGRDGDAILEAQSLPEVWRWKQRDGRWRDADGRRIHLLAPRYRPPPAGADWVARTQAPAVLERLAIPDRGWDSAALASWLAAFTGHAVSDGEPVTRRRPFALAELILFRLTGPRTAGVAAAFRLAAEPARWRVALLELGPDEDRAAAEQAIRDDFLPSVRPLARFSRPPPESAPPPEEGSAGAALAASRLRARESIRNLKGWWCAEGESTIVLSNIRSGKSQLVQAILDDLEALRPVWETFVPPWSPEREAAVVRVFESEAEYLQYAGAGQEWTAGLWMPARRELLIRPMEEGRFVQRRQAVLATVYHEAFHQYLHGAFGAVQASPWFNEGYATLFGTIRFSGRTPRVELDREAAGLLREMARRGRADPSRLWDLDYPDFYAADPTVRREHYALAWGLLYFLEGDPRNRAAAPYRPLLERYRAALRETRDPAAATAAALAEIDGAALGRAFQDYWK